MTQHSFQSVDFQVDMSATDPVSTTVPVTDEPTISCEASSQRIPVTVPGSAAVRFGEPKFNLSSLGTKANATARMETIYEREHQPFPYKRVLTFELPLVSWLAKRDLPTTAVVEVFITVPSPEIGQAELDPPDGWTLSIDTSTLFVGAVVPILKYQISRGTVPHRWMVIVGGILAAVVRRPAKITASLTFHSQQPANVLLDSTVQWRQALNVGHADVRG